MSQINYRRHLESLRDRRDGWLSILVKNPDNLQASEKIVILNSQIQYINDLKIISGDYE